MQILLLIKLIAASTLFSTLVVFFLGYYLIEKPKKAHTEAEIRKIAVEIARAELEIKIKKIEASYAEKIHQLNTEQLNISNKLNLIETGIKESEKEIAVITARHKLPRERSATLKEETEAVATAVELYTSIAPEININSLPEEVKNEDELMTFISRRFLKNEGKFGVHIQTNIGVYLQDKEIDEYEWDGDEESYLNPGQELEKVYKIFLLPNFIHNLTMESKRFHIEIIHELSTDKETVEFVAKKISSHFTKNKIQKKSQMYYTTKFFFSCLMKTEHIFSCGFK